MSSMEGGSSEDCEHQDLTAQTELRTPNEAHKAGKDNVCSFPNCGKSFTRLRNLRIHVLSHYPELEQYSVVQCPICKEMVKKVRLTKHVKRHDPKNKKYKCGTCDKSFFGLAELKLHENTHKTPVEKPVFSCPLCEFTTSLKKYLISHTNNIHVPKPKAQACSVCDMEFSDRRMLMDHLMSHWNRNISSAEERSYKCQECDKSCTMRDVLKLHTKLVHNSGPGHRKVFSTNWLPKYYRGAHEPEAMVPCPICLNQVTMKYLPKHYLRHDNKNKIHKCDQCTQAFFNIGALNRHLLMHRSPAEKEVSCTLCEFRTVYKGYLKCHIRLMHPPNPRKSDLECTRCDKKFRFQHTFSRHLEKHKQETTENSSKSGQLPLPVVGVLVEGLLHYYRGRGTRY